MCQGRVSYGWAESNNHFFVNNLPYYNYYSLAIYYLEEVFQVRGTNITSVYQDSNYTTPYTGGIELKVEVFMHLVWTKTTITEKVIVLDRCKKNLKNQSCQQNTWKILKIDLWNTSLLIDTHHYGLIPNILYFIIILVYTFPILSGF